MLSDLSSSNSSAPGTFAAGGFVPGTLAPESLPPGGLDRRVASQNNHGQERRQFGSSHAELSPAARELAEAIDRYKLQHHRRYITCEEMLTVITQLGYHRLGERS